MFALGSILRLFVDVLRLLFSTVGFLAVIVAELLRIGLIAVVHAIRYLHAAVGMIIGLLIRGRKIITKTSIAIVFTAIAFVLEPRLGVVVLGLELFGVIFQQLYLKAVFGDRPNVAAGPEGVKTGLGLGFLISLGAAVGGIFRTFGALIGFAASLLISVISAVFSVLKAIFLD